MANCQKLAKKYLSSECLYDECRTLQYADGLFWKWDGTRGVYKQVLEKILEAYVLRWLQDEWKGKEGFKPETGWWTWRNIRSTLLTEEIKVEPRWLHPQTPEETDHQWLGLSNGVLDLTAKLMGSTVLVPPTPRWFSPNILGTKYDPNATCTRYLQCLREWFPHDEGLRLFLQDYTGYLLTPDTSHHLALLLEGEGANGKGVYMHVLRCLLGVENCSALSLEQFRSEFGLADTIGKLVNLSSETTDKRTIPAATFKWLTGGDWKTYSRKHLSGLSCEPTARLVMSWNRRPFVDDTSSGFWRRVALVPFLEDFSDSPAPRLRNELVNEELSGILNWALDGWCRVQRAGGFTPVGAVADAVGAFRDEQDPARAFLKARIQEVNSGLIVKSALYQELDDWCADRGLSTPADTVVGKSIRRRFKHSTGSRSRLGGGKRVPCFRGIAWVKGGAPKL